MDTKAFIKAAELLRQKDELIAQHNAQLAALDAQIAETITAVSNAVDADRKCVFGDRYSRVIDGLELKLGKVPATYEFQKSEIETARLMAEDVTFNAFQVPSVNMKGLKAADQDGSVYTDDQLGAVGIVRTPAGTGIQDRKLTIRLAK